MMKNDCKTSSTIFMHRAVPRNLSHTHHSNQSHTHQSHTREWLMCTMQCPPGRGVTEGPAWPRPGAPFIGHHARRQMKATGGSNDSQLDSLAVMRVANQRGQPGVAALTAPFRTGRATPRCTCLFMYPCHWRMRAGRQLHADL